MKKLTAMLLALVLCAALPLACTQTDAGEIVPQPTAEPIPVVTEAPEADEDNVDVEPSEWKTADSPALTDENVDLFMRGFHALLGVNYIPVAYLGKQVVSGTVHTYLTRARVVRPGEKETFALVYLYEQQNGEVRIIDISRSAIETGMDDAVAGFERAEDPVLSDELKNGFAEATGELLGVSYVPVALCGTRVSGGLTFAIIAENALEACDKARQMPGVKHDAPVLACKMITEHIYYMLRQTSAYQRSGLK